MVQEHGKVCTRQFTMSDIMSPRRENYVSGDDASASLVPLCFRFIEFVFCTARDVNREKKILTDKITQGQIGCVIFFEINYSPLGILYDLLAT